MPITPNIVLTIQDGKGKKSTTFLPVPIPGATNFTDITSAVRNWAEAVNDAITGKIIRAGVSLTVDLAGLGIPANAAPDSDVEEGAVFQFLSADNFPVEFRIPTIREELFLTGTPTIDVSDTVIDGILDRVIDGIAYGALPGQDLDPSTTHGEDVVAFNYARSQFLKERG